MVVSLAKRHLRARIGWIPLYEVRNKIMFGHTVPGLWRFENAEVRRLLRTMPSGRPAARVATIVPTYRRPAELVRAVNSVLAQTMRDQVVIVVDDDGGLPRLTSDPRLYSVSLARNIGVPGVSRNIGIRLTESEFIAFLDDDNAWRPDHLEIALAALSGDDGGSGRLDAVYTAMRRVNPDGSEHDVLSRAFNRRAASNEGFLDSNAFVARRTPDLRFSRLRRPPKTLPKEDWELIYRHGRRHQIKHIPEATVEYAINPSSYWTSWNAAGG